MPAAVFSAVAIVTAVTTAASAIAAANACLHYFSPTCLPACVRFFVDRNNFYNLLCVCCVFFRVFLSILVALQFLQHCNYCFFYAACLFIYLFVCVCYPFLFPYFFVCLLFYLFTYLFAYLFIYLFVCSLFICLIVYLFAFLIV